MKNQSLWLALVACLAAAAQVPSPEFAALSKTVHNSPIELLREFEAPEENDYVLGEGDEISVNVWGRSELTGKHIVGPDGFITLPYVGQVRLAGVTRSGAVAAAQAAWAPLYDHLTVTVQILKYESNRIFVLGRVANPGVLHFDNQPTLLEAVTRAGGLPIGGVGAEKAALARCMVFRGRDKLVWIELRSLLNGSNLALNIRLQRNDTLYIPDSDDQLIYVMGEVRRPGAIRMTPDMTFLNALAQAGGPTEDARTGKVRVVRPSVGIEREFNLADFYRGGTNPNVELQDGDVIYVARNNIAKLGYVLQKVSPLTGWMLFTTAFGSK
jgi:polysaccharide biosynthesis/export protein